MYITDLEYLVKLLKNIETIGRDMRGYDFSREKLVDDNVQASKQLEAALYKAKLEGWNGETETRPKEVVIAIGKVDFIANSLEKIADLNDKAKLKLEVAVGALGSIGYIVEDGIVKNIKRQDIDISDDDGTVSDSLIDEIRLVV